LLKVAKALALAGLDAAGFFFKTTLPAHYLQDLSLFIFSYVTDAHDLRPVQNTTCQLMMLVGHAEIRTIAATCEHTCRKVSVLKLLFLTLVTAKAAMHSYTKLIKSKLKTDVLPNLTIKHVWYKYVFHRINHEQTLYGLQQQSYIRSP
jgi:hypothetical protein